MIGAAQKRGTIHPPSKILPIAHSPVTPSPSAASRHWWDWVLTLSKPDTFRPFLCRVAHHWYVFLNLSIPPPPPHGVESVRG